MRLDLGEALLELRPLRPDRRALRPAAVVTGQQDLGGLGEARLARAVAPHYQSQPGAGLQRQRGRLADAAEALHSDRTEVRADWFDRLTNCGGLGAIDRSILQRLHERVGAV